MYSFLLVIIWFLYFCLITYFLCVFEATNIHKDDVYVKNVFSVSPNDSCRWNLLHVITLNGGYLQALTGALFEYRTPTFLHPRAAGIGGEKLWWVPGKEGRCGAHTRLEADADADGGGALQACPCHPAGFHVGINYSTPLPLMIRIDFVGFCKCCCSCCLSLITFTEVVFLKS